MSKDSIHYAYLAEEVTVQRNGAMDELATARTEIRLANIAIASLETELFHAKQDLEDCTAALEYYSDNISAVNEYVEQLERDKDMAFAESQRRLRARIDALEAENARLEALVDWNAVDARKAVDELFDTDPYYEEFPFVEQAPELPPPPFKIDAGGAPGQASEVTGNVFGGDWIEVKNVPDPQNPSVLIPTIMVPTPEDIAALNPAPVGIAGAPGQNAQVIATVGNGLTSERAVESIIAKNSGDVLPVTSTPVDDLQEVVLPQTGDTPADEKIRKRIEELKAEKEAAAKAAEGTANT